MNVTVRKASENDCEQISKIFQNECELTDCSESQIQKQLKKQDAYKECTFVAIDLDKGDFEDFVCGFIHIELNHPLFSDTTANIMELIVSSESRRHGIGKMLIQKAEIWAKENNAKTMIINSGTGVLQAQKFYKSQNYKIEKQLFKYTKEI